MHNQPQVVTVQVDDVLKVLCEIGHIRSTEIQPHIKPGHGPCCTCQFCGYIHDDCVCDDNELIRSLRELENA